MSSSTIIPVVPTQMMLQPLTSNSEHVVSKRFRSFLPEVSGDYSFNSNNTIRITLNSASEFLSGNESYLEFKLTCTAANGGLPASSLLKRYLDHCGQSLFSSMKVQLSNGTTLEDITGYNKLYSIIRRYTMSENHVDFVEGPLSGDSTERYQFVDNQSFPEQYDRITLTRTGNTQLTNAGVLTAVGGEFVEEVKVGDTILFQGQIGKVAVITNATTLTLHTGTANTFTAVGAGANDITLLKPKAFPSARQRAATTASIKIKIKPFSNLLNNHQLLPLMYMKNLQLVLTLERPEFVMTLVPTPANATIAFNYTISDVKYQACLVQPSDEVLEMYRMAYNSESPEELSINIPYVSYQHSMKYLPSPGGLQSFTIPSSCRSAVAIISAFYSAYSETISTATNFTHNVDSTSQTLKNGCTGYVYRVGSEMFPTSEKADVSGTFNGQMLTWAQLALQSHGNTLQDVSFKPNEFFAVNPVRVQRAGAAVAVGAGDIANDSVRAVFASHLCRYTSPFCGVDLLQNDIIAEFDFNNHGLVDTQSPPVASQPQDVYVRSWVLHDRILSVNRAGITVKY